MRKHSFLLGLLISIKSFNLIFSQQKKAITEQPNIIFILTDDQRFDAIGYAGNKYVETPEMDNLAKSGTYFNNAIVTTPICAASRASIMTGLHERSHNFNFQTGNIREEYMTNSYPSLLRNNGYYTGFYGKYGVKYNALNKQFDEYESYDRNNKHKDRRGYFYKTIDKDTVLYNINYMHESLFNSDNTWNKYPLKKVIGEKGINQEESEILMKNFERLKVFD